MDPPQKGECLRYGQLITLSPLAQQKFQISCQGHMKPRVQLEEITQSTVTSGSRFGLSLFKLYPSFVTSRLNAALQITKQKKSLEEDESKIAKRLKEIEQKVIVEYKVNIESSQKLLNSPVQFNQPVQFLHVQTNKYLSCNYKEAEQEKENFRLELDEFPSSKTCFRLQPAFSHQRGVEAQVYSKDSIYIVLDHIYIGKQPKLNIAQKEKKMKISQYFQDRQLFTVPNLKLIDRIIDDALISGERKKKRNQTRAQQRTFKGFKQKNPQIEQQQDTQNDHHDEKQQVKQIEHRNSIKKNHNDHEQHQAHNAEGIISASQLECNVSLERQCAWIINIFSNENEDENIFYYGDIVWINHIEENSFVCMMRNEKDELLISHQLISESQEFQGNSNGMFQLEAEELNVGGPVEWGSPIRLRHLLLGKYLSINHEKALDHKNTLLMYMSDTPVKSSLFKCVPLPSEKGKASKFLTKDSLFKLMTSNGKDSLWVHFSLIKQMIQQPDQLQSSRSLVEESIPILTCRVTKSPEDEDVLKLYKADYSEIQEVGFLVQCFPVLKRGLIFLKKFREHHQQTDEESTKKLRSVIVRLNNIFKALDRFCRNQLIYTSLDSKVTQATNPNRQRILREQFFIELMLEIMKYISTEEELQMYKDHKKHEAEMEVRNRRQQENRRKSIPKRVKAQFQSEIQSPEKKQFKLFQQTGKNLSAIVEVQAVSDENKIVSEIDQEIPQQQSITNMLAEIKATKSIAKSLAHKAQNTALQKQVLRVIEKKVSVLKLMYSLLTSICHNNSENQWYVYSKFHLFLYQVKYFTEATDCIIKIIQGNEMILTNLCDNIRLDEKRKQVQREKKQIVEENSQSSQDDIYDDRVDDMEFNELVVDQVNNNVMLYFKTITEQQGDDWNIQYLQFFRALCRFQDLGISVNQEMIFKFIKQNPNFKNKLFMAIVIETTKMKIQIGARQIVYLTSMKDSPVYPYMVTQIQLYADLALERNYLWKSYLQRIFPTQFVIQQIFEPTMPYDYRSAFCNLAKTIYVDQEPFNKVKVPRLCRLMLKSEDQLQSYKMPKMNASRKEKYKNMMQHLENLVNQCDKFIIDISTKIDQQLTRLSKKQSKQAQNVPDEEEFEEQLSNQLVLDIVRMVHMIVSFDITKTMKKNDDIKKNFIHLVKLLEYDRAFALYSYIQQQQRKIKQSKAEQSIAIPTLKSATQIFTEIGKALTTSVLGIPPKQQESLEDEFAEYDTTTISRNPVVSSLIGITNMLNDISIQKTHSQSHELEIKIEICLMLSYFQDKRQEFYVSNFIKFFNEIGKKLIGTPKEQMFTTMKNEIEENIASVLPPFMRSGVEDIDNEIKKLREELYQTDSLDVMAMGNLLKENKKFKNYLTPEEEIPDLDTLMSSDPTIKLEILPSLLVTFYISTDVNLQDKLVMVMRRLFQQKYELFQYLKEVELLFDENEVVCFHYLEYFQKLMSDVSQCSELWLVDFLAEPQADGKEPIKLQKYVNDLHSLLYEKTIINKDGIIIKQEGQNNITKSKQKIFHFLGVHLPMVDFIRDSQNQLAKVLRDPFYSKSTKDICADVLKDIYSFLCDFCYDNSENQNELFPDISLFLDEIQFPLGQIELVCTIFKDNRTLCERVQLSFLEQMLEYVKLYGRQQRFLEIMLILQSYKGNPILENQIRIRKLFIPHHISTEQYTDIGEYRLFGSFVEEQHNIFLKLEFDGADQDEPFYYHSKILEILLKCTEGEEGLKLNIPRIKEVLKMHYFLELLCEEDDLFEDQIQQELPLSKQAGLSILKKQIVLLITKFYVNNSVIDHYMFINEQQTFSELFTIEAQRVQKLSEIAELTLNHRYAVYLIECLLPMIRYYVERIIPRNLSQDYKERNDYQQIVSIFNSLNKLCEEQFKGKLSNTEYNNIVGFAFIVDEHRFRLNAGMYSELLIQPARIELEQQQSAFKDEEQQQNLKNKNKNKKKVKLQEEDIIRLNIQDWFTKKVWTRFLHECQINKNTKAEERLEMKLISKCFEEINQFLPEQIMRELSLNVTFKDVLRQLIKYIEVGVYNKVDPKNLVFVIQILKTILINSGEQMFQQQCLFDQCGGIRMILNLLGDFKQNPIEDPLLLELYELAKLLIKGGNKVVQQTIFNYLSNFENAEQIMCQFSQVIQDLSEQIKLALRQKQLKKLSKENDQSKNLYLQSPTNTQINADNNLQELQDIVAHRRIKRQILNSQLEIFQLMCEGHNLQIQNYLRYQYNSRNNYNMVTSMVELVCTIETDLTNENSFLLLKNALETLTELVQGPCPLNQQEIIDSKFLELATRILNLYPPQQSQNKPSKTTLGIKKFQIPTEKQHTLEPWMLARLKFKIMVLITSLLELNNDPNAIRRIMSTIPVSVLRNNMIYVYKCYLKLYGKTYERESLKHIEADPRDPKLPSLYHEVIIETGFYMYFLICYYQQLSKQSGDFDPETARELEKMQQVQVSDDTLDQMKNNIIGQLISLAWALTESILSTIQWIMKIVHGFLKNSIGGSDAEEEDDINSIMKKQAETQMFLEAGRFFSKNSVNIEVTRNGNLERVVFFKLSFCNYLPKATKTEFHESVNRDSTNTKVSDLMEQSRMIIEVCKHEEELALFFQKNKFVAIFANYVILWQDLAFLCTLTLNLLVVLSFYSSENHEPQNDANDYQDRINKPRFLRGTLNNEQTEQMFRACGLVMIVCSTFVVTFFLLKKGPLYVREAWSESQHLIKPNQHWIIRFGFKIYLSFKCIVKVLMNVEVMYYLTYGTMAFIGTFVHPFFFAFHLTEVVLRYPLLRNIILSFWEPKMPLLLTLLLIVIFNYYFSLFSYVVFPYYYTNDKCSSLLVCMFATFDYGFKNNGGIGGWFDSAFHQMPDNYSATRFIYDQLNNIIISIILMQIFSGIIIDTFSALREKSLIKNRDIEEICFICGQARQIILKSILYLRELFDKRSGYGFTVHTKQEHYLWNYVFYLAYLKEKNKSEFNGIETYVNEKIKNMDNSWFPIGMAMGLADEEENPDDKLQQQQITQIDEGLQKMKKQVESISDNLRDIRTYLQS